LLGSHFKIIRFGKVKSLRRPVKTALYIFRTKNANLFFHITNDTNVIQ